MVSVVEEDGHSANQSLAERLLGHRNLELVIPTWRIGRLRRPHWHFVRCSETDEIENERIYKYR